MENQSVAVLMSTFNGEKYLDAQLQSIFNQKDVDVSVYVRDDGSSDSTLSILSRWSQSSPLSYYQGDQNLGPQRSFLELIQNAPNCQYYAFSDQDDIWMDDKLITAVQKLQQSTREALFMSTYDVVDKSLNKLFTRDMHFDEKFSLATTLMYRCPSGCVMVFNRKLQLALKKSHPDHFRMHDFWTLLTAEVLGANIYVSNRSLILYRQHENNTVGFSRGEFIKKFRRLIESKNSRPNERLLQAKSVYDNYQDRLSKTDRESLKQLLNYRSSFINKYALCRNSAFKSSSRNKNMMFKLSIMLGWF